MPKFLTTHWGTYEITKGNKRKITLTNWKKDPSPTEFGLGFIKAAKDNLRIKQPYVRKGWLEKKDKNNTKRGKDEFVPISWDKAFDLASKELLRVKNTYGNSSIFAGSYGWASAGRFHHAKSQLNRFFNLFGGFTNSYQSYSYAAAQTILPHIIGMDLYSTLEEHTSWNELAKENELIVMFGGMNLKNSKVSSGGVSRHTAKQGMMKCKKNGVKFINISPLKSDAPNFLKAEQISIRPNTDTALMLTIAYILIKNNNYDHKFIKKYTVGFEKFATYVLRNNFNQNWCSNITGISVDAINDLANNIARKKTLISISWSLQRASSGEQPLWMGITLASMLGYIGTAKGGFGFGYASVNSTGDDFRKISWPHLPQGKNKINDFIPVARITDMLEKPGKRFRYDGKNFFYPNIKLIYWAGGNPFHHHQDLNRLVRAWKKPQTIIVNEIWWNSQARHADIIFPANTSLERNDIMLNPRDPIIVANQKSMKNYKESKTDYEIFSGLADKLNFKIKFTQNKNEMDWIKYIWNKSKTICKKKKIKIPNFQNFWNKGYFKVETPKKNKIMLKNFKDNPSKFPLNTPSGKIEIFSNTIAKFNLKDCFGHPAWFEPYEWLGKIKKYPLHLISNQPKYRLHGQLDNSYYSKKSKIKGREPILINTIDAKIRGINNKDIVLVYNKRGRVLAGAKLTKDVMKGVVVLSTGAWFDPDHKLKLERHGNPNVLTNDVPTSSLTQAPTSHTTLVQIKKAPKKIISKIEIFINPNKKIKRLKN